MPATLTIHDQTASGHTINSVPIEFPSERITVRELIRERVYQEVQDYNRKTDPTFHGLVQPSGSEVVLDRHRRAAGYRRGKHENIDWHQQFALAQDAFTRNGFFILIDNHQAEELDQELVIGHGTEVTFVKLTPMVGG